MLDTNDFLTTIKRAALEAVQADKPTALVFGTVANVSPLNIAVEQKLMLTPAQLVLSRNVTDYKTTITAGNIQHFFWEDPPDNTTDTETDHTHAIGSIEIEVKNALKTGEEVVLLRMQGGQQFLVIDRVVKT